MRCFSAAFCGREERLRSRPLFGVAEAERGSDLPQTHPEVSRGARHGLDLCRSAAGAKLSWTERGEHCRTEQNGLMGGTGSTVDWRIGLER